MAKCLKHVWRLELTNCGTSFALHQVSVVQHVTHVRSLKEKAWSMLQALQPCFAQLRTLLLDEVEPSVIASLVPQMSGLQHLHMYQTALTAEAATALSKVSTLRGLIIGGSAPAEVCRRAGEHPWSAGNVDVEGPLE
jgi:hypothetical protein